MVTQSRSGVSQYRSSTRALLSGKSGKAHYRVEPKCSYQKRELSTALEFQGGWPITGRRLLSRFGHSLRYQLGFDRFRTAGHPGHERSVQYLHQRGERFSAAVKVSLERYSYL